MLMTTMSILDYTSAYWVKVSVNFQANFCSYINPMVYDGSAFTMLHYTHPKLSSHHNDIVETVLISTYAGMRSRITRLQHHGSSPLRA